MAVTPNLGLHQWAAEDSFLRTEFNEDFGKIDSAMPKFCAGSFTPDKQANRAITLGFRPKLVLFLGMYKCYDGYIRNAVAVLGDGELVGQHGQFFQLEGAATPIVFTDTGFLIKDAGAFNTQGNAPMDTQYFAWA